MVKVSSKKRPERKNKREWRRNVDIKDVEDYLDDKRLEGRLGVQNKKNEELFTLDSEPICSKLVKGRTREEKKIWATKPSFYIQNMISASAFKDPITRNRVRTPEEKASGKEPKPSKLKRIADGLQMSKEHYKNLKKLKKKKNENIFDRDLWNTPDETIDTTWFNKETSKITLMGARVFKVKKPLPKKIPEVQAVEPPHPGLSYNPSLADHRDLLNKIAEKELVLLKQEAHINRVTVVPKITSEQKETNWMIEMMSGITKEENDEENENTDPGKTDLTDVKDIKLEMECKNAPVTRDSKKTLKQRRKQKELEMDKRKAVLQKIEKKKLSDIYKLRKITNDIKSIEVKQSAALEKKHARIEEFKRTGVERLGNLKYEEPLLPLVSPHELSGSLRKVPVRPSAILTDRFTSLQRRNILAPNTLRGRVRTKKVKKIVKSTHRFEEMESEHLKKHNIKIPKIKKFRRKKNEFKVERVKVYN